MYEKIKKAYFDNHLSSDYMKLEFGENFIKDLNVPISYYIQWQNEHIEAMIDRDSGLTLESFHQQYGGTDSDFFINKILGLTISHFFSFNLNLSVYKKIVSYLNELFEQDFLNFIYYADELEYAKDIFKVLIYPFDPKVFEEVIVAEDNIAIKEFKYMGLIPMLYHLKANDLLNQVLDIYFELISRYGLKYSILVTTLKLFSDEQNLKLDGRIDEAIKKAYRYNEQGLKFDLPEWHKKFKKEIMIR